MKTTQINGSPEKDIKAYGHPTATRERVEAAVDNGEISRCPVGFNNDGPNGALMKEFEDGSFFFQYAWARKYDSIDSFLCSDGNFKEETKNLL